MERWYVFTSTGFYGAGRTISVLASSLDEARRDVRIKSSDFRDHWKCDESLVSFTLRDVNENYWNCGHYPDWVVTEVVGGECSSAIGRFPTRKAAQAEADVRNERSSRRWAEFLNTR